MIVITCNQVTNKLVVSAVTLDGVTKSTLSAPPSWATEAQLCGLGGAKYENLSAKTYNPSVKIPQ